MVRLSTGIAIIACGMLILFNSASMSFQGYEREFSLAGAGLIGVAISGLAFVCAGAIGIARREGLGTVSIIAFVMAVICFFGDIGGNHLALWGDIKAARAEASQQTSQYNATLIALTSTRIRIETANTELATVSGEDICAAQRLLMSKGLYGGRLDCIAGGLTESAMLTFGSDLRITLTELGRDEATMQGIVELGPGDPTDAGAAWRSKVIAVLLTVLSMAASAIGLPLIAGGKHKPEIDELVDEVDAFEAEVIDFIAAMRGRDYTYAEVNDA